MKITILLFISFIALSLNSQQNEGIKKCSLIDDQMERLACFDTLAESLTESPVNEVMPDAEKVLTKEKENFVEKEISTSLVNDFSTSGITSSLGLGLSVKIFARVSKQASLSI